MVLLFTLFARLTPRWALLFLKWMLIPAKLTGDLLRFHF